MLAVLLAAAVLAAPAADDDALRPAHLHGHSHVSRIRPQDEVIIISGPLTGIHARVLAVQHKFFDAEVWAELLLLQPDENGHLHWILAPICSLHRVEQ